MKLINKKKRNYKYLIFFSFFLSYFFFFLSLEKCYDGEDICCTYNDWMKKKVVEESISIVITLILFQLIILNIVSRLHFIHFVIVYYLFYKYSYGITFDNHGKFNINFFFIIIIPALSIINIIKYVLTIRNKKLIFIYILFFIILISELFFNSFLGCNDWAKGLNNTFLDNNKELNGCKFRIPKSCPYKVGKYILDRFQISSPKCYQQALKSREILLKFSKSPYITNDTYHFGFPVINKEEKLFNHEYFYRLQKYVSENLIDMNNKTLLKFIKDRIPEVSIDYSKNKIGDIKVNVNFNQTLSDERKKLENLTNPYSNNILIVYIDSVSRANSIRQLKKTLKFFEKFLPYKGNHNPNYPSENFHSFQFFKYHSHEHYTPGNYPLLFSGNFPKKEKKYITLYLKKNGYITAYSADSCFYDFVRPFYNFTSIDMYDHHYTICNPNFHTIKYELKCLHGKYFFEHLFEYMEQFWRKYKNNRKFSLLLTNLAHEGTLELLKYIDDTIYNYFNKLFEDNLLKDTSIFLVSDHGVLVPSVYYLNDFYLIEGRMPMFYLIVNDRKNETYKSQYEHLYNNQQSFITAYDIHDTIIHLIYGDKFGKENMTGIKSRLGESLFNKINSKKRSPKLYWRMSEHICI